MQQVHLSTSIQYGGVSCMYNPSSRQVVISGGLSKLHVPALIQV